MPCEPLPSVVQVQDVLALETERRKFGGHLRVRIRRRFRPVGARDAHDLQTHDAPREVSPAVGTADARADARGHERVRPVRGAAAGPMAVAPVAGALPALLLLLLLRQRRRQRRLRVAVHAA